MPLYQLDNISHSYNGRTVLTIGYWQLDSHTVTGVVGPNGSGKTTLLRLLGFVAAPVRGRIQFNGRSAEPFDHAVRGQVALLPQESFLLKRSVSRNIAYGVQMSGGVKDLRGRVAEAMNLVGLDPQDYGRRPWYALSGGETRRVALAARLALHPKVLLLDEPTVSVDAASAQMIKAAALHARRQWGTTLVITSHDAEWLADICDESLHLFNGRIMGNGEQTMIFGPWEKGAGKFFRKTLSDNQHFLASGAPENLNSAVAAIQAGQMTLHCEPEESAVGRHRLEGTLLRLNYEQATARTSAAVMVGQTTFRAYLPRSQKDIYRFIPGQKVWISYDPLIVQWY